MKKKREKEREIGERWREIEREIKFEEDSGEKGDKILKDKNIFYQMSCTCKNSLCKF